MHLQRKVQRERSQHDTQQRDLADEESTVKETGYGRDADAVMGVGNQGRALHLPK